MRAMVADAMEAGAAGFSSSHGPTQLDGDDRPVPSRFASLDELEVLCAEAGHHRGGSISYLHRSAIGGLDQEDKDLLVRLGTVSRLPIILQGLGGRSKVDVPGAGWDEVAAWIEEAGREGVGIYSLLRNHPFDRDFRIDTGTNLYEGVPSWHAVVGPGRSTRGQARACWPTAARDDAMRHAVEHPNTDGAEGSTLPPPRLEGGGGRRGGEAREREVREAHHRRHRRTSSARSPPTPCSTSPSTEELQTVFRYVNKSRDLGGGRGRRPAPPGHDHRRVRRRRPPRPRRRCGLVDGVLGLLGARPQAVVAWRRASARSRRCRPRCSGFEDRGMLLPGVLGPNAFIFDPDTDRSSSRRSRSGTSPVVRPGTRRGHAASIGRS